ncbi:MAG TPA: (5-formylfuran-3-yl)methyl phosphate synthase [Gemmatimonadaceae bacterium]|nr:(5-formylfuran-3-yl)methyl phosphate synthase [Gemmatimonadaceae bacterium]
MKLLVSVATAEDARSALAGGADVIDAKDPALGPLGPVTPDALRAITEAVGDARPVSAALGDLSRGSVVGLADRAPGARFTFPGVTLAFAKVGFDGGLGSADAAALARAVLGESTCPVVLVAYADFGLDPFVLIDVAATVGAAGVLLDTADKRGPGLMARLDPWAIRAWVNAAHAAGLTAAVAGRLTLEDMPRVAALGADVAGVRGAACEGTTRTGRVTALRVRALAIAAGQCSATSAWNDGAVRIGV